MIKEIIERNREEVDEIKKIYNDFYESAKEDAEGRRLFKSLYQKAFARLFFRACNLRIKTLCAKQFA